MRAPRDAPRRAAGCRARARRATTEDREAAARAERRSGLRRDPRELRDDLLAVSAQNLFLALRHQVDVELVDADRLQLAQLLDRLLDGAEHAEAVGNLVGDALAVGGPDARVILVVVELARLDVVSERLRNLRVLAVAL